jgi:hypothetical protein
MTPISRRLEILENHVQVNGHVQEAKRPTTKEALDALYDRLQAMPPWPRGTISPETTPDLCEAIHEALREALRQARGRAGQESRDP